MDLTIQKGTGNDILVEVTPSETQFVVIDRGIQGATGAAATIAVGATTTLGTGVPATVTNVGTPSAAILDFGIPQGAGVPIGGTTGQVLTKISNIDYQADWNSLGTMSLQNANAVAITGGEISDTTITVKDNVFTLQDEIDPTKQARFQLSALATNTIYPFTLPIGASGVSTLADLQSVQTFSGSKTFSSSALNFGSSVAASTTRLAYGATTTGLTKVVDIGTGGLSGSTTNIAIGSNVTGANSTTTMNGTTNINGATTVSVNSTTDALRITQVGTGNALLVEDAANPDSTPFLINNTGQVVIGSTTPLTFGGFSGSLQINTTGQTTFQLAGWQTTSSAAPQFVFARSASGTVGTNGAVVSGSDLGAIRFLGDDGTAFITAAEILSEVDGTPGTSDMPGRLVFSTTADGASSPTERVRISSSGGLGIGGSPTADVPLLISQVGTAINMNGVRNTQVTPATATASHKLFQTVASTAASAFTLPILTHYEAFQSTIGAGSTVTSQYGFFAQNTLIGATNNYGFFGNIASGTGRYNFYAAGTATNYFEGSTFIGGVLGGDTKFAIGGTLPSTGNSSYGARVVATMPSTSTSGGIGFDTTLSTQAAAYTLGTLNHYSASQGTIGAGSTVTNQYGFIAQATLTGATNNYGFYSNIAAATGRFNFYAANTAANVFVGTTSIGGVVGAESLRVTPVASAVNYIQVAGGATSGGASITTQGSDTNVAMFFSTRGAGQYFFSSNASTQFNIGNTASTVNYLRVDGGATGNAATMSSVGADTNIDLALTPKGTGVLRFGTYTAGILAQAGYITIKDAAGNTRNLLVG